jgi:hypothetical protein
MVVTELTAALAAAREPKINPQAVDDVLGFFEARPCQLPVQLDCLNGLGIDAEIAQQVLNLAFQAISTFGLVRQHSGILGLARLQKRLLLALGAIADACHLAAVA